MFFVAGITGKVGGAAARQLLAHGHQLRTLARNPQKAAAWSAQGVDVQPGDWTDTTALTAALQGVEAAFVMVPPLMTPSPGFPEQKAIIDSIGAALRQAPPPRIVALSSIGSEQTSGLGLITATHLFEQELSSLDIPTAFVRAGSFFENYVPQLSAAAATGILHSFYVPVDRAIPMIATEDIGKQVASLLTQSFTTSKIIELGTLTTPTQVAAAMSEALARPVQAQAVPREHWSAAFESFGMPPGSSWAYEEMLDAVNSGWIRFGISGAEPVAATLTAADVFRTASTSPTQAH
jgi:uncharacterized protein YbjT (DUF2867 family)